MPDDEKPFLAGKNINGYYTYHLFINLSFWLPIYAIFFLDHGLTYGAILLLYAILNGSQTLMELPSGVLADRWGRRPILMLAALIQSVGYALIAFGDTVYYFVPGMACLGIAFAFASGSDAAFIYDSLIAAGRADEFKRIEGRAYMYNLIGWGTAGLLGGFIAAQSLKMPFILSAITSLMALFIIGFCEEPPRLKKRITHRQLFIDALTLIRGNCRIRGIIFLSAILYGLLLVCHKFSQPYLQAAHIPITWFGVIYFVWLIGAAMASNFSEKSESLLGRKTFFLLLPILSGGAILYLGWRQDIIGAIIPLGYQFVWGALRPQMNQVINTEATSDMRATVLSAAGFGSSIVYIITAPFIGMFADRAGFENALLLLGAAITVLGLAAAFRFLACDKNR
ncbi:MAG: MFS transporter [Candidatus Zixiibacteriota bacterium]